MARRWIISAGVAAVLVVAAVFAARADPRRRHRHGCAATTTSSTSTTSSTTTTSTPATTAPATTAAPTSTTGPPGPCGSDAGPIEVAVDAAVTGAAANADLASCRLAASDPSWAAVQLTNKPGAQFNGLTVILHGGAGSWAVVAQGGSNAGCGQAPQQVIVDLGQFCVGTGGSAQ